MPLEEVGKGKYAAEHLLHDGTVDTIGHYHDEQSAFKAIFDARWSLLYSGKKSPVEDFRFRHVDCTGAGIMCKDCKGMGLNQERGLRGKCPSCQGSKFIIDTNGENTFERRKRDVYGITPDEPEEMPQEETQDEEPAQTFTD